MSTAVEAAGTPRPTTRRRVETRRRLIDAALTVFAADGFGRVSVEQVCERAGFTRGAFYSNFDSLTEVFVELYQRRTTEVVDRITAAAAEIGDVTTASVADLVSAVLEHLPDDRQWRSVQAEFTAHALRDPVAARALRAPRVALAAAVRPLLGPDATARDADDLARVLLAVHDGLAVQQHLEPRARLGPLRRGALQTVARAALADGLRPAQPTTRPAIR